MALTKQEAAEYVHEALGGEIQAVSPLRLLNLGGRFLTSVRPWAFLERAETTFSLVADQAWVDLPANFRQVDSVSLASTAVRNVNWTTPGGLQLVRDGSFGDSTDLWAAIRRHVSDAGRVTIRMDIFPVPAEDKPDYGTLYYKAGWETLTSEHEDHYELLLPEYAESLYLRILRAYAFGYDEEDEGSGRSLEALLREVEEGKELAAAFREDQSGTWLHGPSKGGFAQAEGSVVVRNWDGYAEDPS